MKGYSEAYSGVLGGYSVDTQGVLRGLGRWLGVCLGTHGSTRTRAHPRVFESEVSALVVSKDMPFSLVVNPTKHQEQVM
jgi:hypothetical protein